MVGSRRSRSKRGREQREGLRRSEKREGRWQRSFGQLPEGTEEWLMRTPSSKRTTPSFPWATAASRESESFPARGRVDHPRARDRTPPPPRVVLTLAPILFVHRPLQTLDNLASALTGRCNVGGKKNQKGSSAAGQVCRLSPSPSSFLRQVADFFPLLPLFSLPP